LEEQESFLWEADETIDNKGDKPVMSLEIDEVCVIVKRGTILLCILNNNGDIPVVFLLHKCMGGCRFQIL
jgi:hypothetical protein